MDILVESVLHTVMFTEHIINRKTLQSYPILMQYNGKKEDVVLTSAQYLFLVTCINKVTDLPIYSYNEKLGGWNVIKNKKISLPVCNGK